MDDVTRHFRRFRAFLPNCRIGARSGSGGAVWKEAAGIPVVLHRKAAWRENGAAHDGGVSVEIVYTVMRTQAEFSLFG